MILYLLDKDEKVIKIIREFKSLYQTQVLTDEGYVSDRLDAEIKNLNATPEYMAIPRRDEPTKFHLFFVARQTQEGNVTKLEGVQSGIEELRKTVITDKRSYNQPLRNAVTVALQGTNWIPGYIPDTPDRDINFYFTDVFTGLKEACKKFDVEMQFFVEITANRIGARFIDFKKTLGKASGRRVVYGHNALQIVRESEKTNLVTGLIGRGKSLQVSESEEGNVGYGRKITFEDVETPYKPKGQVYVQIPEMTAIYGIKTSEGMKPKYGLVEFDEEDPLRLLERTYEYLKTVCRPQVTFKTTSAYLSRADIGDTVRVVRHDLGYDYETRIFEIKWDRITDKAVDMKLGDRLQDSENKKNQKFADSVSTKIIDGFGDAIVPIVTSVVSANGQNGNYYDLPPKVPKVGDLWFQPDPEHEGEVIIKIWNGEMWEELIRTKNWNVVNDKLNEMEEKTKDLDLSIQESDKKAEEALEKVGLSSDIAERARQAAEEASESVKENNVFIKEASDKITGFDAFKNEIKDKIKMTADIVGHDGSPVFGKNRIQGSTEGNIALGASPISVKHNGEGFVPGIMYTLSYDMECLLKQLYKVIFDFGREFIGGISLRMVPESPGYPVMTGDTTERYYDMKVLPDEYTITAESEWYKTGEVKTTIARDMTVEIPLSYKTTADGNPENEYIGEWSDAPQLILNGGN